MDPIHTNDAHHAPGQGASPWPAPLGNAPGTALPQADSQVQGVPMPPADLSGAATGIATPPPWLPPTVPVQPSNDMAEQSDSSQPPRSAQPGTGGQSAQTDVPVPGSAADGDVIEKEWVAKAKQIVAQTRNDPYRQTRELHALRAAYMQKRYNKAIEPVKD